MFWTFYFTIGLLFGLGFLLIGMLNNLKTHPEERQITPLDLIINMLMCTFMWPIQLLIWFKIHNDNDGPWSG